LTISPSTYPDLGYLALINCVNIVVRNLEQTNNGQGLLLVSTVDSTITQNNIANNNQGIMLFLSSNNIISGNNIEGNNRGVQLSRSSTNNSISTNVVTNNIGGVYFFDSSQNIVEANNITDNEIGIGLKSSTNNIIYKNYFINNNKQVDDFYEAFSVAPSINVWNLNYPLGGNYWSDYTGSDVKGGSDQDQFGGDNIGDSPYVIYENNIDNYPLVPFTTPSAILIVSPENKTYNENSVLLTFTEIEQTSWVGYSLDELANVTITKSITLAGLSEGLHRLTVYARNVDGIESSVTIYFTIAQGAEPPQSERFPITGIIIVIVIAAVGASLLVYFMIIRKKR
jgi:parallel beta-helix repeat protein